MHNVPLVTTLNCHEDMLRENCGEDFIHLQGMDL